MKNKYSVIYSIVCGLIIVQIILGCTAYAANYDSDEINEFANRIISHQKTKYNGKVYNSEFVGTDDADWFALSCARLGKPINSNAYLDEFTNKVNLSTLSSASLNCLSLSVSSNGGNPTAFASSNLITDGIYGHSPSEDGVVGWIWSLIALDCRNYTVPSGVPYSRDDIIVEIIRQQLDDGGFAQTGSVPDAGVTGLAIAALSPYINSEYSYSFNSKSGNKVTKTVKNVVDNSIAKLSEIQNSDGSFSSSSKLANSVSTARAVIGLCSVGINPNTDLRFIKSGNSALDGLMKYRLQNGGFGYSSSSDESDYSASQALLAFSAYSRLINNKRRVFDFSSEFSTSAVTTIQSLNNMLNTLTSETATSENITEIQELYGSLSANEQSYIYDYAKVFDFKNAIKNSASSSKSAKNSQNLNAMAKYTKTPRSEEASFIAEKALVGIKLHLEMTEEKNNNLNNVFTESDFKKLKETQGFLSTKYYYSVLSLINKAEKCEPTDETENLKLQLYEQKKDIETLICEIDDINSTVSENFPNLDKVSVSDRKLLNELNNRISILDDYDKQKIKNYGEIQKAVKNVNSVHTTIMISVVAIQLAIAASAVIFFAFRRNS